MVSPQSRTGPGRLRATMAAVIALVLAFFGSTLAIGSAQSLLPPVVINGQRVAPNIGPAQPFPISSGSSFSSQPLFGSRPTSELTLPAVGPPSVLRTQPTFGAQPAFTSPQNVRLQSDFVPNAQAVNPATFRIQNEFVAQPTLQTQHVNVVNRIHQQDLGGSYSSQFETSDGQRVVENGQAHPTPDGLGVVVSKSGSFSYYSPEGEGIATSWIADEHGFRASGNKIGQ